MVFVSIGFILTLFVAALGIHVSRRLKLPSSVGLILIGLFFGPAFLNIVQNTEITDFLAHVGLTFLMFKIGLESDLRLLKNRGAFLVGLFGLIAPWIVGFITMWVLGYNTTESFFIGIILTATSVGITVAVLDELNVIDRNFAKVIIGAAVVDDILGLFALSIGTSIAIAHSFSIIDTFVKIITTLFVLSFSVFFGIKILSMMRFVKRFKIDRSIIYLVLFGMVLLSFIFAEDIGLSGIVGAFFAGLVVSESGLQKEERQFEHMIDPLVILFSPLFFLNLGLLVTFSDLAGGFSLGITLTIVAILCKYIGCYYGARKSGMDQLDAMLVGFGMIPRGEVALIAAQIGLTAGIISSQIFSALIIMTLFTSLIPPLIFFYALTPYTHAKTIEEFESYRKKVIYNLSLISRLRLHLEQIRLKEFVKKIKIKRRVVKF